MGGLFSSPKAPAPAPVLEPETTKKKGATDLEKMRQTRNLQQQYGKAMAGGLDKMPEYGDTSLASGSLLSLGGTLG